MAHGAPDYFGTSPQGLVHRVADLAELAARLGSPDTFDRRGNVLMLDSFDNGLAGWTFNASGGVADAYCLVDPVHISGLSAGIYTDAVAGAISSLYRNISLPFIGLFGFECAFLLPFNARDVLLSVAIKTGMLDVSYAVRWRQSTGVLAILNQSFLYQTIATPGALYADNTTWYVIKVVIDPVTRYYKRLLFNAVSYDISSIGAYSIADTTAPFIQVTLAAASDIATARLFPFDDVIITMNE